MKKVVVIGAGISGLTAAIYAQRSGFDVTLCEQNECAGGMCTAWKRKGYLFEGSIHCTGSNPKTELYKLWKDTGALGDTVKINLPDVFHAVEWEGQIINLYRDIEKTVEHLTAISPEDGKQLRRLVSDVKAFSCLQMPIFDIKGIKTLTPKRMTFKGLIKMLPVLPTLGRLSSVSCKKYAEKFVHPGIRKLFCIIPDDFSCISLIATLSTWNMGDGGFPEGGSLGMLDRMVKTFEDLGGKILLKTKVKCVNIENKSVTGVKLTDGTPLAADAVIVTQETIAAVEQLFDKPLNDAWLAELRNRTESVVCTFIGVGIRAKILQTPIPKWKLTEPITCAGKTITEIGFNNYFGHEGYAPEGCTTLTTTFTGDTYLFWKKAKEEGRYEDEKRLLSDQIRHAICQKYPQATDNIEVIDIATPLTYERYTGAYHGSWMSITGLGKKMRTYPGFLKKISGVYFAGHRLMTPGGLPVALYSGHKAAQMICRQYNVMFR
ncbi:MAG: NAD(P)/FAD-dependent oxidoreductase [Tannerella sp.]|jgi:phytoene dehydrogenase-like protein|nr:NAD(P)/FAD-dependent oxidoreductase [Tannerella sp.]